MQRPQPDPEPELFVTDLSALNQLYQAAKLFLKQPSLTTKMALKMALDGVDNRYSPRHFD